MSDKQQSSRWYYEREGKKEGPCTFEELRRLAESGVISERTKIGNATSRQWIRAGNVPGLLGNREHHASNETPVKSESTTGPADIDLKPPPLPMEETELTRRSFWGAECCGCVSAVIPIIFPFLLYSAVRKLVMWSIRPRKQDRSR
ncbi:DUF4339 domain-containing protein [Kolteria novifilia]|uniref:DUF4339 domain-containing protein n=1 Tax=Kolteria novifilia TaxID=2527975 RepID=UPI003AF3F3E4